MPSVLALSARLTDGVVLRRGATLLIGAALALQLAASIARIHSLSKQAEILYRRAPSPAPIALAVRDEKLPERIAAAHLFGAVPPPVQFAAASAAPQELQLEVTLLGTLAAKDPEKGLAILGIANKQAKVFAPRDRIDLATSLLRVFGDRVVVSWRGAERTLTFPHRSAAGMLMAGGDDADSDEDEPPPRREPGERPPSPPHSINVPDIVDTMEAHPRMVGGAIDGVQIVTVHDEEKLSQIGLQYGDIITTMDGVRITDPRRINDLLMALSNGKSVTATVIRDGETSTMVLAGN